MNASVIDALDLMMDYDDKAYENEEEHKSADEMLIESLNKFGAVDISYIAQGAGISSEKAALELRGAIFQQPELFDDEEYDIAKGWVVSASYLSGNAEKKLETARRMNIKYPGRFESNIEALKRIMPTALDIEEIHISLGASWIPVEEYKLFIRDFLNLREDVTVIYNEDLARFKIISTSEASDSILNTITYGVRGAQDSYGNTWTKQYLTALDIIEGTLNAKTIKVFDYIPTRANGWGNFEYEPVFNKNKTVEAQDKQKQIIDAFKDWVYSSKSRTARFEGYYNDTFVGYTFSQYDGEFLKLPDLNPEITLYKHQKDAIARVLLSSNNTLLSHDVGTGKTYEMIVSVHELKRMGLSDKNLIAVPNNVLKATVDAHTLLYKDDKILTVYPKDFTPDSRNEILAKIRDGDYVAVYMAYSSFDMIVMSKKYYVDKLSKQISELKSAAFNAKEKYEKKALERQAKALSKKLSKYVVEETECAWLTFDKLGINTLVVDEAHNYKNIPTPSRSDNIVGMSNAGSKKCREMLEKAHFVDRLIFATGTPLTNSLADLFTLQTYLQPSVLKYHNIHTFDTWVNTFGQRETTIECDVDANSTSLRTVTRFSSFHNLGELMALFSQVCDFHHMEQSEEGLPHFLGAVDLCVPKNETQAEYIRGLSERTELIRNKEVKRTEDNLLKVTTDGRKAALDIRLVDGDAMLGSGIKTKVDVCVEKVYELYQSHPDTTQIVFSDIGTPKASFNVYDCLKKRLVALGILETEIAFVHDATTESARSRLFAAMNKGQVRVVIGSTQKLGVGVNVQEKLVAIHHLSVPWRPADMIQREGRILRKGNTCEEVFVYRYITEGSFDAYSWQLLENKQRFISSFLSGTSAAREMGDIADAVLTYAEVKALAIGNPLIKKLVEVANTLERTKIASRARQRQMQELRVVIEAAPEKIAKLKKLAKIAARDFSHYMDCKEKIPNDERIAFGEELLEALKSNEGKTSERIFDEYQGFDVVLPASMVKEHAFVLLKSKNGGSYYCEMETDKTPIGCGKTLDYLLEHLKERSNKLYAQADEVKKQMREAKIDLEQDNTYLSVIEKIKAELAEIDQKLEGDTKGKKKIS